jgi:hypothetical protein
LQECIGFYAEGSNKMATVQPYQILVPLGIAFVLGIMILLWGDRPELAKTIRDRFFGERVVMSPDEAHARREASLLAQKSAVSPEKTNSETAETPHLDAETENELISFGETQALARLIAAGKLGLTEAVKIGADAKSGEKYQKRSREIKEELARISGPQFLPLDENKRPVLS